MFFGYGALEGVAGVTCVSVFFPLRVWGGGNVLGGERVV